MARQYYYNPHQATKNRPSEKKFIIKDYLDYISSHAWLGRTLKEIATKDNVRVSTLRAALTGIGLCTSGFSTNASQKLMASRCGLSVRAFNKALHALRKARILSTRHRYTGSGPTKRRTTSITVVGAFLKFLDSVAAQAFRLLSAANTRKQDINGFLGRAKSTVFTEHPVGAL